ncbi:wall-associated receptor kinase-like 1 [Pyrus ussuriensis x Pyrus communis]|uniref:Wall-associated receptor kinase-like 1 n=1 Tax=Pyrus ussuriensis x Pyrus communis TaxID=2448454 RepID=A0A5N5IAK5_9ROSA|nr:wall-associated receptor kinase-like 1 [Pyrus ussuriensis x Pyrus communis]
MKSAEMWPERDELEMQFQRKEMEMLPLITVKVRIWGRIGGERRCGRSYDREHAHTAKAPPPRLLEEKKLQVEIWTGYEEKIIGMPVFGTLVVRGQQCRHDAASWLLLQRESLEREREYRFNNDDAAISPRFTSSASESYRGPMGKIVVSHGDLLHWKTVEFEQESKNSGRNRTSQWWMWSGRTRWLGLGLLGQGAVAGGEAEGEEEEGQDYYRTDDDSNDDPETEPKD